MKISNILKLPTFQTFPKSQFLNSQLGKISERFPQNKFPNFTTLPRIKIARLASADNTEFI